MNSFNDKNIENIIDLEINAIDHKTSSEQEEFWFLGSLMNPKGVKDYTQIAKTHNRITYDTTGYTKSFHTNCRVASQLSEFFPAKWLREITVLLQKCNKINSCFKSHYDRVSTYLGCIELYLNFRGLTIVESTLQEINNSLNVHLTKDNVRKKKIRLLNQLPTIRQKFIAIREKSHQSGIFSIAVQIMNNQMVFPAFFSKEQIFNVKQRCLQLTHSFIKTNKAKHIKKPEVWAHAICMAAIQKSVSEWNPFPLLSERQLKVIHNKCWQLTQIIHIDI